MLDTPSILYNTRGMNDITSEERMMVIWTAMENLNEETPYSGLLALSNSKLKFSIYDGSVDIWTNPTNIPSVNPGAAINPVVKSEGGVVLLVWTVDRDGNLFTEDFFKEYCRSGSDSIQSR